MIIHSPSVRVYCVFSSCLTYAANVRRWSPRDAGVVDPMSDEAVFETAMKKSWTAGLPGED